MKHFFYKILIIISLIAGFGLVFLWLFSSKPINTPEDEKYLSLLMDKWGLESNPEKSKVDFDQEIRFISSLQDSVFSLIKGDGYPIPKTMVGNIRYYMEVGKGACYDRALLMEKILNRMMIQTRHVFIYFNRDSTPIHALDVFKKRLFSHALLEVKTSRGWMTVDTRDSWLGLSMNKEPLSLLGLKKCWDQKQEFYVPNNKKTPIPLTLTSENFRWIYGLYSRHGEFLPHPQWVTRLKRWGVPIPDYNLSQLWMNLTG